MTGAARARLLAQLDRLAPADAPEARDRGRIRELVESVASPFDRTHFTPGHLTASAIVLHPDGPAIALVLHGKLGMWLQPGGHAERGDDDALAIAAREVLEETGLVTTPAREGLLDVDVHPIPARPGEPAHEHFDLRYALRAASTALAKSDESRAIRWATLPELVELEVDPGLLRAARKALSA